MRPSLEIRTRHRLVRTSIPTPDDRVYNQRHFREFKVYIKVKFPTYWVFIIHPFTFMYAGISDRDNYKMNGN